jgi:cytochrome b561
MSAVCVCTQVVFSPTASLFAFHWSIRLAFLLLVEVRVITKLPNSEQSYKGKVKTHKYINRQNQSTTGKLWKP